MEFKRFNSIVNGEGICNLSMWKSSTHITFWPTSGTHRMPWVSLRRTFIYGHELPRQQTPSGTGKKPNKVEVPERLGQTAHRLADPPTDGLHPRHQLPVGDVRGGGPPQKRSARRIGGGDTWGTTNSNSKIYCKSENKKHLHPPGKLPPVKARAEVGGRSLSTQVSESGTRGQFPRGFVSEGEKMTTNNPARQGPPKALKKPPNRPVDATHILD